MHVTQATLKWSATANGDYSADILGYKIQYAQVCAETAGKHRKTHALASPFARVGSGSWLVLS